MCDCESVMNSPPLTLLSEESTELEVLTTSSFLSYLLGDAVTDLDTEDKPVLNNLIFVHLKAHIRIIFALSDITLLKKKTIWQAMNI